MISPAIPAHVPVPPSRPGRPLWQWLIDGVLWLVLAGLTLWAIGAIHYDFPKQRNVFLVAYVVMVALAVVKGNRITSKVLVLAAFLFVLTWWLSLRPSNDRSWQPDVAQMPWAEIDGDKVTLHNVRNCEYRTETDYTPHWETRTVDLSKLRGIDLAINYWGSAWMAHPIASFQFDGDLPVCFSIETRKEIGESYSAIGGIYRQYELVYICADERDVLRVRTNYRKGEDVYLYRTTATPEGARKRFLEYVNAMNALREKPRWYNAVTTNCTTGIRNQRAATDRAPWDYRMLLNGYGDEMLYERHGFKGDLPFAELKKSSHINEAAKAADTAADFSAKIRANRPGFVALPPAIEPR
jgi:hypothetical protein